jgi:uncharacterized protein Yka (UPF0111/DUF47 family)
LALLNGSESVDNADNPIEATVMTVIYQNNRSEEEVRKEIKAMGKVSREIRKSPESAFRYLVDNGFVTEDGKLTQRYGGK